MKVLYSGLKYNYGKKAEDTSFEFRNIEHGIKELYDTDAWHPDEPFCSPQELISRLSNYDIIFHVAFNESLDLPLSVAQEALKRNIPVVQWDCDASWRFHNWILPRKNRVSHFVTTHSSTVDLYKNHGMKVIKSQWGGSSLYRCSDKKKKYDVGFAGQKHGIRQEVFNFLIENGIDFHVFGHYWQEHPNAHPHTPKLEQMMDVLHSSKICLNLSNPWHINTMPQIKGRHFEIPQCGGFQISTPADNLHEYFVPDKEIVIVNSGPELLDRIKYYLMNENKREEIAVAGYNRMMKDHQWTNRFKDIFNELGY